MNVLPRPRAFLVLVAVATLGADTFDYRQQQSPPRPAPAWVKMIDQGKNDPRLKGYQTPEGLKVEIVAENPVVVNPVGLTFADDGTPHVLEWRPSPGDEWREKNETFTYKDGSKRDVPTMTKRVRDVVKILRDTKNKGVYDEAKVILEDELPSSILLHDGWIYLSGRGTVRRFKQSRPGGPYDAKEVIAKGFCGFHHHQVSGMTIGNDGWLYLTSGDNDNYVEGSDGSRATVLRTGAIFRCRPDGSKLHTFAIGFRNPYRDVAFDTGFNLFHADNDNEDGSKFTGCRLMHIAEGNDFGWRLRRGARCCVPDPVRGAVYGELPGKVAPLLKTGRGAPAGLLIYNDTRLPPQYRGLLIYPDVFRKNIRAYKVESRGATFAVTEEFELMKSDDPLYRPCQAVLGPDGAIYVVDWRTDSGGAGRLWGDGTHGRIYRLSWAGVSGGKGEDSEQPALPLRSMDSWAKIATQSDAELLKTLASPEASFRSRARVELVRRGDRNRKALLKLLHDGTQPEAARIAALGALESMWNGAVQKAVQETLLNSNSDLRRLAADALGLNAAPRDEEAHSVLLKALGDDDLTVRRAVALAMGRVGAPGAADNLVNALSFDDSGDAYLRDGLIRGIEYLGKPGIDRLVALASSGVGKDTQRTVDAFTALRTRPAADAIPELLKIPHLSIAQRASLVRSYNNYLLDPPVSLKPLLAYLKAHPDEAVAVKLAALEVLAPAGALRGLKDAAWLIELLDETEPAVRLEVLKGIEEARPAGAAPRLEQLLGDSTLSVKEREATLSALLAVKGADAPALLKDILSRKDNSVLRRAALRALAQREPASASARARAILEKKDTELTEEAVQVLAANAKDTQLLGRLYLDGKLSRSFLPQVSAALRTHAKSDPALGRMLAEVVKSGLLIGNKPAELARIARLVETKGNPERGRALFLNSKALACVTCHRLEGVGGNVGPDLTRLWDTTSLEKLMESILEPSKEIKEGFQAYQATTKRGQVYTGLRVVQTADEVILRDSTGRDIRIPTKDLEELAASKRSLMPDDVIGQLSFDELLDLFAFLRSRKSQESLRGLALEYLVVGPFGGELATAYEPEARPDGQAAYTGTKPGEKLKWRPAQAEASGLLNLRAIFQRDNISAYALVHVHAPKAQKVEMRLGSDDGVRVWVNGKRVHEVAATRGAQPDQDRVAVMLKAGWNAVLVKVVNGAGDHALYLRFVGDGLRLARVPEEMK